MKKLLIASLIMLNSITTPVNSFSFKPLTKKSTISKKLISIIEKALETNTIANSYLKKHFGITTTNLPIFFPVKLKGFSRISSFYGKRKHPILGITRMHKGIDLAGALKTPVYATANGIVRKVRYAHGHGKYIIIDHGNEITSLYGHLNTSLVKEGDKITLGQQIALLGNTGISTGPHLHYEVRVKNKSINLLDLLACSKEDLLNTMLNFQNYKQWENHQSFQTKF